MSSSDLFWNIVSVARLVVNRDSGCFLKLYDPKPDDNIFQLITLHDANSFLLKAIFVGASKNSAPLYPIFKYAILILYSGGGDDLESNVLHWSKHVLPIPLPHKC